MKHKQAPLGYIKDYYQIHLEDTIEFPEEVNFYLSYLGNVRGKSVLSIGCGPNFYDNCSLFGEIPKEYFGIDINKNNFEFMKKSRNKNLLKSKKFVKSKKVKTELILGSIFDFRDDFVGRFDTIYAEGVMGMFSNYDFGRLLEYFYKYLKPKGRFIDIDWTDCLLPKEEYYKKHKYGFYVKRGRSIEEIRKLLNKAGFRMANYKLHIVKNPKEYEWGRIYGYMARKD